MQQIKRQIGCYFSAVIMGAIGGAMVGLMAAFIINLLPLLMPKIMAWMMPQMLGLMEKAEVDPPCAHILKEYFEEQKQAA